MALAAGLINVFGHLPAGWLLQGQARVDQRSRPHWAASGVTRLTRNSRATGDRRSASPASNAFGLNTLAIRATHQADRGARRTDKWEDAPPGRRTPHISSGTWQGGDEQEPCGGCPREHRSSRVRRRLGGSAVPLAERRHGRGALPPANIARPCRRYSPAAKARLRNRQGMFRLARSADAPAASMPRSTSPTCPSPFMTGHQWPSGRRDAGPLLWRQRAPQFTGKWRQPTRQLPITGFAHNATNGRRPLAAAIGTARGTKGQQHASGSLHARPTCCQSATSTWSSRCPRDHRHRLSQQGGGLRPAVQGGGRDHAHHRRGSPSSRCAHRCHRRPP